MICPAAQCIDALSRGGNILQAVRGRVELRRWLFSVFPWWKAGLWWIMDHMPLEVAKAWEVLKLIQEPQWRPDRLDRELLAWRWVDALDRGGLSEREALALIIEKDAPAWSTAHEIIDVSELPERTYRDAWTRSANGGPIVIDETKARAIDETFMWERYNGSRA